VTFRRKVLLSSSRSKSKPSNQQYRKSENPLIALLDICVLLIGSVILRPYRRMQYFYPKHPRTSTELYGVISQKTVFLK
jgi:hypothetical protein